MTKCQQRRLIWNVGGGLPAIVVCQPACLSLIHRYRGQAPSHIGFVVFSGSWHALDGAVYHRFGHFQQMPCGMDSCAVVGLQVIATLPHRGRCAVDQMGNVKLGVFEAEFFIDDEAIHGGIGQCFGHGVTPD